MDPVAIALVVVGTALAAVFNYYLNRAPGTEPDDFRIGPPELSLTCDCYLNTVVVGLVFAVFVVLLAPSIGPFVEAVSTALLCLLVITVAGVVGRRRRYREWRHLAELLDRVVVYGPHLHHDWDDETGLHRDDSDY